MKKIIILSLFFLLSCTQVDGIRLKKKLYATNKEYLEQKYQKKVDNKDVGFYVKNDIFHFVTMQNGKQYEVSIDKEGKILDSKIVGKNIE